MNVQRNVLQALQPERLGLLLKGYEERPGQLQMAESVLSAFEKNHIALIEAGTGTGKSLAYLIPALLWSKQTGERIVISTNTIALQEQLLNKDIPLALKLLDLEIPVVLAKGMGNYLCLFKLHARIQNSSLFSENNQELLQIAEHSQHGCRSDFPFQIPLPIWQEVKAESDSCLGSKCPSFSSCHFVQARKNLEDAKIILVNHHLLFSDLSLRGEKNIETTQCVLPPFSRLILDEGHHIEDIATSYFANRAQKSTLYFDLKQQMLAIQKLTQIVSKDEISEPSLRPILLEMNNEWFLARRKLNDGILDCFTSIEEHLQNSKKLLLGLEILKTTFWKDQIHPQVKQLLEFSTHLLNLFKMTDSRIDAMTDSRVREITKSLRLELLSTATRIAQGLTTLLSIISPVEKEDFIRWCECGADIIFAETPFDIASTIRKNLFNKLPTCVVSSATLTIQNSFKALCEQVGLGVTEEGVKTHQFESPFNYSSNALFAVPSDILPPDHPQFEQTLPEILLKLIQASRGGVFILFTSYQMLEAVFQKLSATLFEQNFLPLKQGLSSRSRIIQEFKEHKNAVLFGTDSFWEGVDVSGTALRQVIITKLPFQVPTDPLAQARSNYLAKKGKNAFMHYWLPKAIVKFKQGFGRLIRSNQDFGAVVCLDSRLIEKAYGKLFTSSIPKCPQINKPLNELLPIMTAFYKSKGITQ